MIQQHLLELQWRQLNHDELYHREIARLTVGDRMKHMTLHLAKYVGHIAEAATADEADSAEQHLVDVYIICLSAANVVNLDLAQRLGHRCASARTVLELGQSLVASRQPDTFNTSQLVAELAIGVGHLAKACESLDHVETYAFREKMQDGISRVFETIVVECTRRGIDLEAATVERQDKVRARHVFDGYLRPLLADANGQVGRT